VPLTDLAVGLAAHGFDGDRWRMVIDQALPRYLAGRSDHPALELSLEKTLDIKRAGKERPTARNEVPRHVIPEHNDDGEAKCIEIKQPDGKRADSNEQPFGERWSHDGN